KEFERLVAASADPLKVPLMLIYYTGIRNSEIVALEAKNIVVDGKQGKLVLEKTKNGFPRVIPFKEPRLAKELQRPIKEWKPSRADRITKLFAQLRSDLKIDDLLFYDLRKTFTTNVRRSGVDIATIQRLTGHKDIKVLQKHYSVFDEDDLWVA